MPGCSPIDKRCIQKQDFFSGFRKHVGSLLDTSSGNHLRVCLVRVCFGSYLPSTTLEVVWPQPQSKGTTVPSWHHDPICQHQINTPSRPTGMPTTSGSSFLDTHSQKMMVGLDRCSDAEDTTQSECPKMTNLSSTSVVIPD